MVCAVLFPGHKQTKEIWLPIPRAKDYPEDTAAGEVICRFTVKCCFTLKRSGDNF